MKVLVIHKSEENTDVPRNRNGNIKWTKGSEYSRRLDYSTFWTKLKCFFGYHKSIIKNVNIYQTNYHCKFCYCEMRDANE